jgi:hypothetical protein
MRCVTGSRPSFAGKRRERGEGERGGREEGERSGGKREGDAHVSIGDIRGEEIKTSQTSVKYIPQ